MRDSTEFGGQLLIGKGRSLSGSAAAEDVRPKQTDSTEVTVHQNKETRSKNTHPYTNPTSNLDFLWTHRRPPPSKATDQITPPVKLQQNQNQNQNLAAYVPPRQHFENGDAVAHLSAPPTKQILDHNIEYAKQKARMGRKSAVGEIVEVQGGHIVRSTGRKDRHSKVYTAKGPRDRRVRLSAYTAIQFYDVQDRLGYDRPSKAVDWLIKKAKSTIDKLAELPPCYPTAVAEEGDTNNGGNEMLIAPEQSESSGYNFHPQRHLEESQENDNSGFVPHLLSSVPLTDTMKTFFPTSSETSSINFQTYPPDILSRTANPIQDLGLSLHTFQEPSLIHSQLEQIHSPPNDQNLFSGSHQVGYEPSYQRMVAWGNDRGAEHGGGFVFNSLPFLSQGSSAAFSHRGPLQSSYSHSVSVRSWNDLSVASAKGQKTHSVDQPSLFGTRFVSDGLNGFCIPGQIPANDDHGMISERLSPSSMNSHH